MPNILVTTFGATWQIVPELLGFTNPGFLDLYANHPEYEAIAKTRLDSGILPVDEAWMITTKGARTDQAIERVRQWHRLMNKKDSPVLRIWQVAGTEDLSSEAEYNLMAECIFRLVLHASERVEGGQLIISLAGGRKTMSSDIQNAAMSFGCHALLHVIQNEKYAPSLREYGPDDFIRPLPREARNAITPLVAGRYERNPVLYLDMASADSIRGARFPIPFPAGPGPIEISVGPPFLTTEIHGRQEAAGFLYCNHTNRLMYEESGSNFLALYNLPPSMIEKLKAYLDKGLRVTVNTDNPGISRTDFSNELHRAARLTPGGLSIWEILLLIRNGFKAAFSRRPLRQKLLREAESQIIALIQRGLPL